MGLGYVPIRDMKERLSAIMRLKGEELVITETVFRNSCAWAGNFAIALTVLIFGPAIWIDSSVEILDVVRFLHFTMFTGIVGLQGFYLCGKCRFLNRRPYTRGYKRHSSMSSGT